MPKVPEKQARVAFLFLTRAGLYCEGLWRAFFKGVPQHLYTRYAHSKDHTAAGLLRPLQIPHRISTQWGDISLVRATMLLYEAALRDPSNRYFILVSESCVPVVDFRELYASLKRDLGETRSFLAYRHIGNRRDRYKLLHPSIKQRIPWPQFYSQHQWMILNRPHVELLLQHEMTERFQDVHAVDEHYVVTLLLLLNRLGECIQRKTSFCDWSERTQMHPRVYDALTPSLLKEARTRGCFFLRKVAPECRVSRSWLDCVRFF